MKTADIIAGMQILQPYYEGAGWNTSAEHDVIFMFKTQKPVSTEDREKLQALGWDANDVEGWSALL